MLRLAWFLFILLISLFIPFNNGSDGCDIAIITSSDNEDGDQFGMSVSISNNYLIVGAPQSDDQWYDTGIAYIFEYDNTYGTWK